MTEGNSNDNAELWANVEQEVNDATRTNIEERIERKETSVDQAAKGTPFERHLEEFLGDTVEDKQEGRSEVLSPEAEKLVSLRWKNLVHTIRTAKEIDNEVLLGNILLKNAHDVAREKDSRISFTRDLGTDRLKDKVRTLETNRSKLAESSPEAHIALRLLDFKEQVKRLENGSLFETDSVKRRKKDMLESLEMNEHIFLHGHLGGGKTEFAIETATERMIDIQVRKELNTWMQENPNQSLQETVKRYTELKKKYQKGLEEGNPEICEKVRQFLISGSKDFNLQDLYTEKTLVLTHFNGKELSEHSDAVDDAFKQWEEENKDKLHKMKESDPEEFEKTKQAAASQILELYVMKNTGFGTEVKKIKKELTRALTEGRPIIIDEANAIPATLLISMNDILTKKPGQNAYIAGEGAQKVKEGFSVIMTGNLSSRTVEYFGTNEMNPAFLSRIQRIEYDYLPQNKSGNLYEQKNPENNELFQVIVAFLAEKDGSLQLPEGSLEKIFRLAQFAKLTQDVFSGKWEESEENTDNSGDKVPAPMLYQSVMSPRAIINVLKRWNKGQDMDLDKALWDAFVSQAIMPMDQNFLLKEAWKKYGFFQEKDGWGNIGNLVDNPRFLNESMIRVRLYEYHRPQNKVFSPRDVMEALYGKAPDRLVFPDITLEAFQNTELNLDTVTEIETFVEELDKYEKAFQIALEKEGCVISQKT